MQRSSSFTSPVVTALLGIALSVSPGCSDDPVPAATPAPPVVPVEDFGPLGSRPDLPVDERLTVENLSAPVDVVRDRDGRPHIYAANTVDAMRVQGYMIALDRAVQLEFMRRLATGRLAQILASLSPSLIDQDIVTRHIGLARVAKVQYDALPPGELRDVVDAYADGVTQVFQKIRGGTIVLPEGVAAIPLEAFTDWSPVDSLAVGRFQTYLLSYDIDAGFYMRAFFDGARATFSATDPDPLLQKRAGLERDFWRFAPADPASTTTGYPVPRAKSKKPAEARRHAGQSAPPKAAQLARGTAKPAARAHRLDAYLSALRTIKDTIAPEGFGSNNWAVDAAHSATGHALVASDPHLSLSAPSAFWPVSMHIEGAEPSTTLKASGVAFPGVPGITLGHNEHVGWGATVAGYDVADVYEETLTADGKAVMFNGRPVPLETIDEVIEIQGQEPYTYKVQVVPHHGPILPVIQGHKVVPASAATGAMSVRWTGFEPTEELAAGFDLLRAGSVAEAEAALQKFGVGAQNWVIGDTAGDILWTSHALIPVRDPGAFAWNPATYEGTLPCMPLPGDGTAEWKGYLDAGYVPAVKSPAAGYIATANNDPIGDTVDNDPSNGTLPDGTPMYLHCSFDAGFREGRIQARLAGNGSLSTDDFADIQADVRSAMGSRLSPVLLQVIDRAEQERTQPGAHPDLAAIVSDAAYDPARIAAIRSMLDAWGTEADYRAASGVNPDTSEPLTDVGASPDAIEARASKATLVFNVWLVRILRRTLGDEYTRVGFPSFNRQQQIKTLLRLFFADPQEHATFDPATQDSAIWDDLDTPVVESRDERVIRALLDTITTLDQDFGADLPNARWGAQHRVTFDAIAPLFASLTIPPSDDPMFPKGFPRPGDEFAVDSSEYAASYPVDVSPDFTYIHGPVQRFVVDLDPSGPRAFNATPGGNVWDKASPHFRDQAELWRKNQTHQVPFLLDDVITAKESRTVMAPP